MRRFIFYNYYFPVVYFLSAYNLCFLLFVSINFPFILIITLCRFVQDIHYEYKDNAENDFTKYIGQRLANSPFEEFQPSIESPTPAPKQNGFTTKSMELTETRDVDYFLDSASRSSGEVLDNEGKLVNGADSRCFRYSPETTDYDSNCGDLDSLSGDFNMSNSYPTNYSKYYTSMPILEDGLSSGHASDTENNNPALNTGISLVMDMRQSDLDLAATNQTPTENDNMYNMDNSNNGRYNGDLISEDELRELNRSHIETRENVLQSPMNKIFKMIDPELDSLYSISIKYKLLLSAIACISLSRF